jgi:hypothetical protein
MLTVNRKRLAAVQAASLAAYAFKNPNLIPGLMLFVLVAASRLAELFIYWLTTYQKYLLTQN